eukprot:2636872-Amphidinium_carterae.1
MQLSSLQCSACPEHLSKVAKPSSNKKCQHRMLPINSVELPSHGNFEMGEIEIGRKQSSKSRTKCNAVRARLCGSE